MSAPTFQPDLHDLGVAQLAAKLAAREVSSVEVTQHFLSRIQQQDSLGAFLATNADVSLAQARAADAR
ncbi:MAG: Asp-tRNA(Asn)/Glu-tRNA(Gln) amidotransferase GatCAB subunit A, partial [Polaromonas sp.]